MSYMDELNFWLNDDYFDQKTKDELLAIRNNEAEVEDRFYKELEFGTGGLRGVIGAGTNRMNVYTVRKATQGLANYIISAAPRARVWLSHLTPAVCLPSFPMRQQDVWQPMASRHTFLNL